MPRVRVVLVSEMAPAFENEPRRARLESWAVNVPQKTSRLADWEMFTKPPTPAMRGPKRLTFTLPWQSACAIPRHAMSRPPPS